VPFAKAAYLHGIPYAWIEAIFKKESTPKDRRLEKEVLNILKGRALLSSIRVTTARPLRLISTAIRITPKSALLFVEDRLHHFDREGYFSAWVKRFRWQPSRWNKEGYLPERPLVGAYAQDNASIGRYCDLYAFIASQLGLWHERNVYQSLGLFYANRELFNAVIEHG